MLNPHFQKPNIPERPRRDTFLSDNSSRLARSHFPPESLLTRSSLIKTDRSRQLVHFLSSSFKKDISYLYDSLTPKISSPTLLSSSTYPLPSEISELQLLLESDDYSIENIFKRAKHSKPYGRTDAISLSSWLEDMHNKYLSKLDLIIPSQDFVDRELTQMVESIYLIALKESIKQISVHCIERAAMLHRVFEILMYTWKKTPDDFARKVHSMNAKFTEDLKKLKNKLKLKYDLLLKSHNELESTLEKVNKENELLKNSQSILSHRLVQVKEDNEVRKMEGRQLPRKQKVMADAQVQTDEEVKEVEESSSDSSQAAMAESERIFARQQSMVHEKKTEHLQHLKKHIDMAGCSGAFVLEDLYQYISSEYIDFYAWVDGFRLASEILAAKEQEVEETQIAETVEEEVSEEKKNQVKEEYKRKLSKESARVIVFKPGVTIAKYISENAPVEMIIEQLETFSLKKVSKISKMALRKLLNSINFYIYVARSKPPEHIHSFAIFVYSLIFQKYSMQQPIVDRKFKELIASCLKFSSETHVQMFSRMLGVGKNLGLSKFFLTTIKMSFRVYDFMYSDKTGIMLESPNQQEMTSFPVSRAFECIRQLLEPAYLRSEIGKLKKEIEAQSIPDPESLNKNGMIDIHQFVYLVACSYQDYSDRIYQGVRQAVDLLSGYHYLTWEEAVVLVRNINPKRQLNDADKSAVMMNQTYEIEIEEFSLFCLTKGVLRSDDFHRFFARRPPAPVEITEKIKEIKEELEDVLGKAEGLIVTLSFYEWNGKLDDITIEMKSNKQDHASKLWMLFWSEYQKILNTVQQN